MSKNMINEELQIEASTMVLLCKACNKFANDDLSMYACTMALLLNVNKIILGYDFPVLDRNDWIQLLVDDPSNIHLQKWIFAWMYVRSNYKKFVSKLKHPEERFEEKIYGAI